MLLGQMIIFSTPSKLRKTWAKRFAPFVKKNQIVVNVAKGLEEVLY